MPGTFPGSHPMVSEIIVCSAPMVTQVSTSERLAPPLLSWARSIIRRCQQNLTLTRSYNLEQTIGLMRPKFSRCFSTKTLSWKNFSHVKTRWKFDRNIWSPHFWHSSLSQVPSSRPLSPLTPPWPRGPHSMVKVMGPKWVIITLSLTETLTEDDAVNKTGLASFSVKVSILWKLLLCLDNLGTRPSCPDFLNLKGERSPNFPFRAEENWNFLYPQKRKVCLGFQIS